MSWPRSRGASSSATLPPPPPGSRLCRATSSAAARPRQAIGSTSPRSASADRDAPISSTSPAKTSSRSATSIWDYANKGFAAFDTDIANQQARLERDAAGQPRIDAQGKPEPKLTPLERERITATIARTRKLQQDLPRAQRYDDYRQMLDKQKNIDGVVIATPDHMHASIALAAMDLGKHVYVQKPLCWSVAEARALARKAKSSPKLATQMGNQGHSWDDARTAVEYVWAGAIGEVREIHIWTNRPLGYWPQGIPRPEMRPAPENGFRWNGPGIEARLANAMVGDYPETGRAQVGSVPRRRAVGALSPGVPPVQLARLDRLGRGALGDMGAHLIDHSMWALDLGYPTSIETVSTPFNGVCFPHATMTMYEFPARGSKPPVKLTWYDGGLLPKKPIEIGEEALNPTGGALLIGSKGKLMHDTYGKNPRLLPESLHKSFGSRRGSSRAWRTRITR